MATSLPRWRSAARAIPALMSALVLFESLAGGCATSAPVTVRRDRFNFNDAGAESAKEQILLNIVRLRYGEPIYFVDIGSMLSHYALTAAGSYSNYTSDLNVWNNPGLRAVYNMRGEPVPGSHTWGANLEYTDSPTITYTPLTGEEFSNRVMAPIPPTTIIYLSKSGWSIDRLLECCVQQINDVGNTPIHELKEAEPPDISRFRRLAELLKKAQDSGALRLGVEYNAGQSATYLYLSPVPQEMAGEAAEVRSLLGLPEGAANRIRLSAGDTRTEPNEVAMQTRSVLATMYALAQAIPVPAEHLRNRQVSDRLPADGEEAAPKWLRVEYSHLPQVDPFAQVFYNGYWFYIDKSDWSSKRTFALLTYLFSLQATTKGQAEPLLTVPAGR
ncbi:MAG TPA: hypothetical protein VMV94_05535 [Phycisphaerae bacterium]|nr:hypothetical protein [Phycisphaerae bacterium]